MSYCANSVERTARKPHRCEWCYTTIQSGERLVTWTFVDDVWLRTYMHKECYEAISRDKDGWEDWSEVQTNGRRGMSCTESDDAARAEQAAEEAE